ncbi:hypothetical protein ACE14D_27085, partial [Streptomyces sp. Act-28]
KRPGRAAPRSAGGGGGDRPAGEYVGLVAVDVSGEPSVSCAFRPPGLRAGAAGGSAALLVLLVLGVRLRRARRPRATKTSPVHHRAVPREPAGTA